jgi:hypothetical protein
MTERTQIHWREAAARLRLTTRQLDAMIRDARPTSRRPIAAFYLEGNVVTTEVADR